MQNRALRLSYNTTLPINPLKKKDLLSLLPLIPEELHQFYNGVLTSHRSSRFEINNDEESSDEEGI